MISLIYGGSGSGKSAFAEQRVLALAESHRYYLATMQIYGEEGKKKVFRHRKMREDKHFTTIEKPRDIAGCITDGEATVLLECVSNLVANEMFTESGILSEDSVVRRVIEGIRDVAAAGKNLVIVSNNIFEDEQIYTGETEQYRRALGAVNRQIAAMSDEVVEVVASLPVYWKGEA